MKPLYKDQSINYVDAGGKIRPLPIRDILSPTSIHVQVDTRREDDPQSSDHIALATYNEDKTPNTFHFPDDEGEAGAPAKLAPSPEPFTPGKARKQPQAIE